MDERGRRSGDTVLINNTAALMQPGAPDPERIHFFYPVDERGTPQTLFVPRVPGSKPGEWCWMKDGINTLNGDDHYLYADIYRPRFIRLICE